MKAGRTGLFVISGMILGVSPTDLTSCGPFLPQAVFVMPRGPANPRDGFAQGRLGVIQPRFRTAYLVVAYRYLSGQNLNQTEVDELFPPKPQAVPIDTAAQQQLSGLELWIAARNKAAGQPSGPIDACKSITRITSTSVS